MYTEYIFENKNYEVACRDLKATLFDIVTKEKLKISEINELFVGVNNEEVRSRLIELYNIQEQNIDVVLQLSNQLVESMKDLDAGYKSLAEMKSQLLLDNKKVDEVQQENTLDDEQVNMNDSLEAVKTGEEIQNSVQEESKDIDIEEATEIPAKEVVTENADFSEDNSGVFSEEVIKDDVVIPEVVPGASLEGITKEEQGELKKEDQGQQTIPAMTVPSDEQVNIQDPVIESTVQEGSSSTDALPEIIPLSVPEVAQEPVLNQYSNLGDSSEVTDAAQNPVIVVPNQEQSPVADLNAGGSSELNTPVPVSTGENDHSAVVTNEENPASSTAETTQSDSQNNNEQVENNTITNSDQPVIEEDILRTKKTDNNSPKVIIITKHQADNLKNSRDSQTSIMISKGLFKFNSTGNVSEQQLINNGLLPPVKVGIEEKVEQMMQQANELYNSGKIEEAQAIYDQISAMNNNLEQVQVQK